MDIEQMQSIRKRGQLSSDRRTFLAMAPLAGLALAAPAKAERLPEPTRDDMEAYFAFLWAELGRVTEELGIRPFDYEVFSRQGGWRGYKERFGAPASARALTVLRAVRGEGGLA